MKNIAGYKPLQDPNWIVLSFDDGSESTPVNDPAGEYRAEIDQIAQKIAGVPPDPMANATASLGSDLVGGAGSAVSKTDVPTPVSGLGDFKIIDQPAGAKPAEQGGDASAVRGALKSAMRAPAEGGMPAGDGAIAPPGAPAPQPAQPQPGAGPGPLVTTGSTSSWQRQDSSQRSSSGIAEADRPKVEQTQEAAVKSAEQANEADFAARANQVWSEWGRLTDKAKQQVAERSVLQEQERAFNQKLESAYKKYDEDAKRPIDPAQAFAGEKRWYAFMAGFGDVLRNVGAALAGKGPVVDPGKVLDDLVERSVQLQMAQKEQDLKSGRISIDRFNADRETVRHKLGVVVSQLAQTELEKAQTEQTYKGLGAIKAKGDAIVADARAKGAQALARQETIAESHGSTTGGTSERQIKPSGMNPELVLKQAQIKQAQLEEMDADEVARIISVPDEDGKQRPVSVRRAKAAIDGASDLAVKLPRVDVAEQQLENVLKELGVPPGAYNRETGVIDWQKAGDLKGAGPVDSRTWLKEGPIGAVASGTGLQYSDPDKVADASAALQESITFMTTGATATKQQQETFKKQSAAELKNEQAVKDNLQRTANQIATQRKSMLSGNPDATRLYEHNRTGGNVAGAPSLKPGVN